MLPLRWLNANRPEEPFPPAEQALAEPNGLLAVGGDLSPARLLSAYRSGVFPWYGEGQPILWWSPDPRGLFCPGDLYLSRRLLRTLRQRRYAVTLDQAPEAVIAGCASPRIGDTGTWITREMQAAYLALYDLGHVHTVEVWDDEGGLVGGLYGVALDRAFFGESMFSSARDASKFALAWLLPQLWRWGFHFFDCQMSNPHLERLGVREVTRAEYLRCLDAALVGDDSSGAGGACEWGLRWCFDADFDPLSGRGW
ncbi:leucyl/phenylalanyl-tRNA--protein transferase [Halorhodospira abdelmalekii]|uniref:leucyl/phenylalanyl-tRNA--protein transferase n=1 Tax=Halorhodospira abdelmalekii TaxID=421629 RepID=UPI001908CE69|nr:leucyl/phenylalanyl-tRNA--protein transferase [Halorhodospira abdelmalekii]MBK1733939.1 leucyl/phenylalanyl-tRNA--protein transferase [Halorhodospira abdelmalekii]